MYLQEVGCGGMDWIELYSVSCTVRYMELKLNEISLSSNMITVCILNDVMISVQFQFYIFDFTTYIV